MKNLVNLKVDREGTITGSGPPEEAALFAAAVSVGLKAAKDAETDEWRDHQAKKDEVKGGEKVDPLIIPLHKWQEALRHKTDPPSRPNSKYTWHRPTTTNPKPGVPQVIIVAPTKERADNYARSNRGYAPTLVRTVGVAQASETLRGFRGRVICVDPADWQFEAGRRAHSALDPLKSDPDSEVLFAHTLGTTARSKG